MIILFEEKDLVSFGEYLLSDERKALFEATQEMFDLSLEERLAGIHDSDIDNWKIKKELRDFSLV